MRKVILGLICGLLVVSNCYADWTGQADKRWRNPVTVIGDLPTIGNQTGDVRYVTASAGIYGWNGAAWVLIGSGVDALVAVSATDTTPSYLNTKLLAGDGLGKAIVGSGNEQLNLYVNVDNVGIETNSDTLRLKDGGVAKEKLNANVAGVALTQNLVGKALDVKYDNLTVGVNITNQLEVKDNSITEPKLALANAATNNYFVRWNGAAMEWADVTATVGISDVAQKVHQTGHTFTAGTVIRWDSGSSLYVKALADTAAHSAVVGIVSYVDGVDDFTMTVCGNIDGNLSGLVAGTLYYLSPTSAGTLTSTEPTTFGQISKPVLIAYAADSGYFFNFRGLPVEVVSASGGTQRSVAQAHAFVVGDVLRLDPGTGLYTKAIATNAGTAEVVGMVASVVDANNFVLATHGYVSGLAGTYTAGNVYFLSNDTAGAIEGTVTTTVGEINKPVFIATSAHAGYFFNWRGIENGAAEAAASATYLTVGAEGSLTNSRRLAGSGTVGLTDGGAGSTMTLAVVADSIGDTQLAYNTGQNLTTASNVQFAQVTAATAVIQSQTPTTPATSNLGSAVAKYNDVYAVNFHSGDVHMENGWIITEDWNGNNGILLKSPNGKVYKFALEELK